MYTLQCAPEHKSPVCGIKKKKTNASKNVMYLDSNEINSDEQEHLHHCKERYFTVYDLFILRRTRCSC